MESEWNEDRTLIYTYVTILVGDYVKGDSNIAQSKEIIVEIRGGEVGDMGLRVSDTPQFRQGEDVFLFLRQERPTIFKVVGRFQGKYTVQGERAINIALGREIALENFTREIRKIMKESGQGNY